MLLARLKLEYAVAITLLSLRVAGAVPISPGLGSPTTDADGFRGPDIKNDPGAAVNNAGTFIGVADRFVANTYNGERAGRTFFNQSTFILDALAPFNTNRDTQVYAINNAGVIVGTSEDIGTNREHAVRYAVNDITPTRLDDLGFGIDQNGESGAFALNSAGTAVGYLAIFDSAGKFAGIRGVRWNAGSSAAIQLNGIVPASQIGECFAVAINTAGVSIGVSGFRDDTNNIFRERAVRWNANSTTAIELNPLQVTANGSAVAVAHALNDSGVIVGESETFRADNTSLSNLAVRWNANGTTAISLGDLGHDSTGAANSEAIDVNAAGAITGNASKYSTAGLYLGDRAVRWNPNSTQIIELGVLSTRTDGRSFTEANAINDRGTIVGDAEVSAGQDHATMWLSGTTQPVDLNALVPSAQWTLEEARSISDTGFITGVGQFDPDSSGPKPSFTRTWTILVPQAGAYGQGDANFDAKIDFNDLVILAQHYNQANASTAINVGDFNLDGHVNFDDMIALAQNYNTGSGAAVWAGDAAFVADWALASTLVPEPIALAASALLVGTMRRSRRAAVLT